MANDYIKTEYLPLSKENHFLRVDLYYSLGGYNVFTYKEERRGYYMSVSPVEKSRGFETYIAISGTKYCMFEVARKTKKQAERALVEYENVKSMLVNHVLENQGLRLADTVIV